MTFFRAEHKKNYTVVHNFIITDKRLSAKAKGIWLYAFSRPEDWIFHLNDIVNNFTDGKDSIKAGLKELEEFGYLHREQNKRPDGKFSKVEWVFYESPRGIKIISPQAGFPLPENPLPEKPVAENPPLLSTDLPSTESLPNTKQQKSVVAAVAAPLEEEESEAEDEEKESLKKEGCELPRMISIANHRGQRQEITQTQLYELIIRNKCDFAADAIRYAWKVLCDYNGPIGDWWRFFEGTATNYVRLKKAKTIKQQTHQGDRKCQTKTSKTYSAGSSESDSSEPASPKSTMSVMDYMRQLGVLSETPKTS